MQHAVSYEARTSALKIHKRRRDLPNLYLIFALYVIYLILLKANRGVSGL